MLPSKLTLFNPLKLIGRVHKKGRLSASPPVVLAGGFIALITLGTLLLMLPWASHKPLGLLSALFMATSAVTVTGLSVVDVGGGLTLFGQLVLLGLVQIGGLGFVTFGVIAALTLGKRISLRQQGVVLEAFNQTSVSSIRQTALAVFKLAAFIELVAIAILTLYWLPEGPFLETLYRATFHSIMGFNNSGFALLNTDLRLYAGDTVPMLVTTALIILGGIGFFVLNEVRSKLQWRHLSVYSRCIIIATLLLNVVGFILIWLFEYDNPLTLGELPLKTQALGAWLQSVTARTAGFTTLDVSQLRDSSTLVLLLYMFIGGGSLSTASGIKVGTFVILVVAVQSYLRRRPEIVIFKRSIAPALVQKSLALLLVTATIVFVGVLLLTILEKRPLLDLLFEVVSALSTTGMTRNVTSDLGAPGQVLIMLLMFVGRIGPLTFIYNLSTQNRSRVGYPETQFQVG